MIVVEQYVVRTYQRQAPSCTSEGHIEHVAVHSIKGKSLKASLSSYHRLTQRHQFRMRAVKGRSENRLVQQSRGVRMHDVGTTPAQQHTIRVLEGMVRQYGV